ncbi:MAG: PspC domain-containing protein [Chloroflexota bacterium]|nr:PspC domain-containing protein [Chloroflexota bacterium]
MNGTGRLYRSTSDAMLGGVSAGLASYFNIDPTLVRLGFVVLTVVTGGAFGLIYLALWLLLPTPTTTATDANSIIHENLNDMGNKLRNLTGMQNVHSSQPGPADPNALPQSVMTGAAGTAARSRPNGAAMFLIGLGVFFLATDLGLLRLVLHEHVLWPLLLIGVGVMMLRRRR